MVIYEQDDQVVIAAMLPTAALSLTDNQKISEIAIQVESKLKQAVNSAVS